MPLIFVGLSQENNRAFQPISSNVLNEHLGLFAAGLKARDIEISTTRSRIAHSLAKIRAGFKCKVGARVIRGLESVTQSLMAQFAQKFIELERSANQLAEKRAQQIICEFLNLDEASPLIAERLKLQVEALLGRLPNRFGTLRINPNQSLPENINLEVIRDPLIALGCAEFSGRSGTVTLDWRRALEELATK